MPPIKPEPFYDPNTGQIVGTDSTIWQYNFFFKPEEAFLQKGTVKDPVIYWLDVQAIPSENLPGTAPGGTPTRCAAATRLQSI